MWRWWALCCLLLPLWSPAATIDTLVKIDSGYVAGSGVAVRSFKGIPYAAAPAGDLRWKPPQPVKPWNNVRMAKQFSVACPQRPTLIGDQRIGDDCLSVNVWTPARSTDAKLPILVWIHGGAFEGGSSANSAYDGELIASQGVMFVSINYRVGLFGFLAHPELSKESPHGTSGNYGLMDMIEALRWVQRNGQAFGGDPSNVTLWGESAGATGVMLALVMPDAKGLFHKAIANSAWNMYAPITHVRESWYGRIPAETVGERYGSLSELRKKTPAEILALALTRDPAGERERTGEIHYQIVDGRIIPNDPAALFDAGRVHNVPLLAGSNADEGSLFSRQAYTRAQLQAALQRTMPPKFATRVLQAYGVTSDEQATGAAARIMGDMLFVSGTRSIVRAMAKVQPQVYQYEFTRINGIGRRSKLNAYHAAEIAYNFGTLPDAVFGALFGVQPEDFSETDYQLSRTMNSALLNFVKSGSPSAEGLPQWPAFRDGERYIEFGDTVTVKQQLRREQLDAVDAAFEQQRSKLKSK